MLDEATTIDSALCGWLWFGVMQWLLPHKREVWCPRPKFTAHQPCCRSMKDCSGCAYVFVRICVCHRIRGQSVAVRTHVTLVGIHFPHQRVAVCPWCVCVALPRRALQSQCACATPGCAVNMCKHVHVRAVSLFSCLLVRMRVSTIVLACVCVVKQNT